MVRTVVRDACHDQLFPIVIQHDMLIQEHTQSQSPQLPRPGGCSRVVLMVARHKVRPMAGDEPRERSYVRPQLLHASVYQVPCHRDHVGGQCVDGVDDGLDIVALDRCADMDVADLRDGESMQSRRQIG